MALNTVDAVRKIIIFVSRWKTSTIFVYRYFINTFPKNNVNDSSRSLNYCFVI